VTLQQISVDPEVLSTMFEILEYQRMVESRAELTLIPEGMRQDMLTQIIAAKSKPKDK
jgi:hypothetical protein